MNIQVRDTLIKSIDALVAFKKESEAPGCNYIAVLEGRHLVALKQLARDLGSSTMPLVITYADIAAIEASLLPYITVSQGRGYINTSVSRVDKGVLAALDEALEAGVLITQDKVRGRISGR